MYAWHILLELSDMRAVRLMAEPNARAQPSLACAKLIWERHFSLARGCEIVD
jgi:hypothetical protein